MEKKLSSENRKKDKRISNRTIPGKNLELIHIFVRKDFPVKPLL